MQEAEEQDTCRICSAPAEAEQPLFYPCKCSGTIRYIHQDCLTTWLAHSKKKTCDVCKHPYSFTKVYATDMPTRLPPVLLLRRVAQQAFFALLFVVRLIAVGLIWLAVLPWVTVMTWRMYFSMGDTTAWWISDRPRPPDTPEELSPFYLAFYAESTDVPPPETFIARVATHPFWLTLSSDIFTGQIIASLVVLTFVAVFSSFASGYPKTPDLPPAPQQLLQPPAAFPAPPHPNPNVNDRIAIAQRQLEAIANAAFLNKAGEPEEAGDSHAHSTGVAASSRVPSGSNNKMVICVKDAGATCIKQEILSWKKRLWIARALTGSSLPSDQRLFSGALDRGLDLPRALTPSPMALAFRLDTLEPTEPSPPDVPKDDADEDQDGASDCRPSLDGSQESSSWTTASSSFREARMQSTVKDGRHRRPQLPNTTPTIVDEDPAVAAVLSPTVPALSPKLATYRAPEELEPEAGPSRRREYFDRDEDAPSVSNNKGKAKADGDTDTDLETDDMEAEHARYFADAEDDDEEYGDMPKLQAPSDSDDDYEEEGSPRNDDDMDVDFDMEEDEGGDDEDGDEGVAFDAEEPIWQAIQIEDEEVAEVGDGEMDAGAVENDVVAPAPAPAAGPNPGAIDLNDDMDGNVEDDMEGAMEAIGMRGPVYGVVQNAALMIFVLDTAIGLLVWIPFTLGKSTALLSLDPQRFLQILHLPIRAMRIVTDPIVDSVVYIIASLLLPLIGRLFYRIASLVFLAVLSLISLVFGRQRADQASEVTSAVYSRVHKFSDKPLEQLVAWNSSPTTPVPAADSTPSTFQSTIVQAAEPYFAALGRDVRLSAEQLKTIWTELALGHGPKEKVFAIALGYVVVMILVSLYLNLLTVGSMKTAGRAVRTAVREQLLVLKVAAFIFIELVTFPLGCGIVLDICTVCLFPEASLISRVAFFKQAPLTAMFYHWVAGTMFMYSFAVLLAGCRTLLRKGAMWFIKDPQAQDSHPIRDILDRPTLTQLRKICVSGVMYSIVVACVVGSVAGLLFIGSKSILPFRWKNREPLSSVPVDLLFLHVVLPYTTHYFRPRTGIKRVSKAIWKFLASRLRLSSYFFGGRYPHEEYTPQRWSSLLFRLDDDCQDPTNVKDGSFRRVPASDNISLPRDMRATALVNELGEPLDTEAEELIRLQNEEAAKAKRNFRDDYAVVYIPPGFRYRVFAFIAILWVLGAMFLGVVFALPIQLGRSFFGLFIPRPVHDGYSFIAGAYLLWACYLAGRAVDRLDKRRQRRGGDEPRADLRLLVVKRGLLWSAKIAYMILFLGIIIPTLIALVVDLYIVLPIRLSLDPTLVPRIRIVDEWAMGLLFAKIMLHVHRAQPANPITRGVQHITTNGWTHPEPVTATREVIAPVTFGLLGMILLPGGLFLLAQHFIPIMPRNGRLLFIEVYPAIFVAVAGVRFGAVLFEMLGTWSQAIRDKEFLVEMRLRNLEPETPETPTNPTEAASEK
ncbi:RING-CH-type domain-containing protein [Mycena sanguinolenta]|uniref:RING-type E3 ubiquitin transferase n=1 Tax=Mycena sanguinolenta TaxID=230812 RepID=A0A8H6Z764_9AGAR|nr:RING-CH-type domain-containing protein [Mycena sanguinolenta]